jgi:hypothetical protein
MSGTPVPIKIIAEVWPAVVVDLVAVISELLATSFRSRFQNRKPLPRQDQA